MIFALSEVLDRQRRSIITGFEIETKSFFSSISFAGWQSAVGERLARRGNRLELAIDGGNGRPKADRKSLAATPRLDRSVAVADEAVAEIV